jgi:hypothetical protein
VFHTELEGFLVLCSWACRVCLVLLLDAPVKVPFICLAQINPMSVTLRLQDGKRKGREKGGRMD